MIAIDEKGEKTTSRIKYYNDQQAPEINISQNLQATPVENIITDHPYIISGTVSDSNLASLLINDTPVGLTPSEEQGEYQFSVALGLEANTINPIIIKAIDQAGNTVEQEYLLKYLATTTIEILSPSADTDVISKGSDFDATISVRLNGETATVHTVTATLKDKEGVEKGSATLSGDANLKSGTLVLPSESGDYLIEIKALDSDGNIVTTSSQSLTIKAEADIPLEVLSTTPLNGDEGIEPNNFISISFNRAIDIQKLTIKVYETAQGVTWVDNGDLGVDALQARGYELKEVNRSHEAVAGNLSLVPGDKLVAFYPSRDFSYHADIYVDVEYDGSSIERIQFKTRGLPTFINGVIQDQFNQPISGISVAIPELNRSAITNKDGAYTFGYGDDAKKNIKGGSYKIVFNPRLKDIRYGSVSRNANIQIGRANNMGISRIPVLNKDIAFTPISGGKVTKLLENTVTLDLTEASLLFPDSSLSGNVQAQFYTYEQSPYPFSPLATPLWIYGIQPSGIEVTGQLSIELGLPKLNQSNSYVPPDGSYVLLLGLNKSSNQISPVGVGIITNNKQNLKSVGATHFDTLDVFAYTLMPEEAQTALKDYTEDKISLPILLVKVNQAWDEARETARRLFNSNKITQ